MFTHMNVDNYNTIYLSFICIMIIIVIIVITIGIIEISIVIFIINKFIFFVMFNFSFIKLLSFWQ